MVNQNSENGTTRNDEGIPSTGVVNIAVMGVTGTGKTTFANLVSGGQLAVGHGLTSCTSSVQAAPNFQLDGYAINLIDTPGFDDTDRSEVDILKTIASYFTEQYNRDAKLQGVIYFYGIDAIRMGGMSRRAFGLFRSICGTKSLQNVSIVTTRWDKVTSKEGTDREKELEEVFFKPALDDGAKMYRYQNTRESANELLRTFLKTTAIGLSLQTEIVDEQKIIFDTTAGIHVEKDLKDLIERVRSAGGAPDKLEEYLRDEGEIIRSRNQPDSRVQAPLVGEGREASQNIQAGEGGVGHEAPPGGEGKEVSQDNQADSVGCVRRWWKNMIDFLCCRGCSCSCC